MKGNSRALLLGGLGLAVILVLQFAVFPLLDFRDGAASGRVSARKQLAEMKMLAGEYRNLVAARKKLSQRGDAKKGTLFALLDGIARNQRLSAKIESMAPASREAEGGMRQEEVRLRFRALYQRELVAFLHQAEVVTEGVSVSQLGVRRDKDGLLDVEMTLTMLTPAA